jgi:cytochrome c oxidase subunit 1/cytochrome c oxidase subunit I+III
VCGSLVLDDGHQTPATTPLDADVDRVLTMPSESPWPFFLAAAMTLFFTLFLAGHYIAAAIASVLIAGALLGWHQTETHEA